MEINKVFLKKNFELYATNENVFITNRKRSRKYPKTFINILDENKEEPVYQKFRTVYILLSALIDGIEPDEYNRVGKQSSSFYDEELLRKKKEILTALMTEKKKEEIHALINEYNRMKR